MVKIFATEENIRFRTARSSGPGGQNVNRRETKVQARILVSDIPVSKAQKALIEKKLGTRITKRGELEVVIEEERTQEANKAKAINLLNDLITKAIKPQKKRIPTKIPKSVEAKFQEKKKKESKKKQMRKFLPHEWLE